MNGFKASLFLILTFVLMPGCSLESAVDRNATWEKIDDDLLLSTVKEDQVEVRPVDPLSLEEIPHYEPLQLGHHYSHAVSPNKGKMIVAKYPNNEKQGELYRIDMPSWTEKKLDLSLSQRAELLTLDEKDQVWWVEGNRESSESESFQLLRYNMKEERRFEAIHFPPSFRPIDMRLLQRGIAVYGFVPENNRQGTAQLLIIQEGTGEIAHTVSLDKVKEGISEIPSSPEIHLMKSVQAGLAWDLPRDRLYVVDSEEDWITEIDLLQGKVNKQGEIKQTKTLWERLIGGLLPQAEAKEMVETARRVEISPDGRQLYVVSVKGDVTKSKDGVERWRQRSTGLQVITTDTFRQVNQLSLPVNDVALSPDGRYLIMEGIVPVEGSSQNGSEYGKSSGVYLYDAQKMKPLLHLPMDNLFLTEPYFSTDGRYAYLSDFDQLYVLDVKKKSLTNKRGKRGIALFSVEGILQEK